ncbi:hypothetical protein BDZ85DRAFT_268400 [Elsinoe ampelina]|uniref:Uncharacterized protein n=1 Tax=Elsinoe ampelina TaxID=302913 RepID=A0A6A6G1A2_9PEZI|nr:hypothetical protein BDZ85DRAFT_268400 [Elsinoe ampelina]
MTQFHDKGYVLGSSLKSKPSEDISHMSWTGSTSERPQLPPSRVLITAALASASTYLICVGHQVRLLICAAINFTEQDHVTAPDRGIGGPYMPCGKGL